MLALNILLFYAGVPFAASLLSVPAALLNLPPWLDAVIVPGAAVLLYRLLCRKINLRLAFTVNAACLALFSALLLAAMLIGKGSMNSRALIWFVTAAFPFAPMSLLLQLVGSSWVLLIAIPLTYAAGAVTAFFSGRRAGRTGSARQLPALILCGIIAVSCVSASFLLYGRRPEVRYGGHGFAYMSGYSSTDFSEYMVYAESSKLAQPDEKPPFMIEREEDMPVMDGAEACYPLYAALAKAVYRDIAEIEQRPAAAGESYLNGRIVTFSNSVAGFERLLLDRIDLFFGARPSAAQLEEARNRGIELEITTIGWEGFVFFVEKDNPVDNLTSEQIKAVYHGDIVNWKEVGGPDEEILAFQRPANSGSQTMMEYFMGDLTLKEPMKYETVDSMIGVLEHVAQYAGDEGALGYSFRYFLEGLNQEPGVKLLMVDGIAPTLENIEDGTYPLIVPLCLITRRDNDNPYVQKMTEFILSEQGQEIVRRTGYAGVGDNLKPEAGK